MAAQRRLAAHDVSEARFFDARFGEQQRAVGEIERGEPHLAPGWRRRAGRQCSRPAIIRCSTKKSSSSKSKTMRLPRRDSLRTGEPSAFRGGSTERSKNGLPRRTRCNA